MRSLLAIALLSAALSTPAFAAHERMFLLDGFAADRFPCSTASNGRHALVNVLHIADIEKVSVGANVCFVGSPAVFRVNIALDTLGFEGSPGTMTVVFAAESDADAFMALWQDRIEDAR